MNAHLSTSPPPPTDTPSTRAAGAGVLCPYCGNVSAQADSCDRCRGVFEPLSRQASQNQMGPWFIRDESNPFRPGCSYRTLRALIARGRVTLDSVLRGPTTHQFWMYARHTPGVAHLTGECHACHQHAEPTDPECRRCGAVFEIKPDRQFLGLSPIRLLPGQAAPDQIAVHALGLGAVATARPAEAVGPSEPVSRFDAPMSPYVIAPPAPPSPAPVRAAPPVIQHFDGGPNLAESLMAERRRTARASQRLAIIGVLVGLGLLAVLLLILVAVPSSRGGAPTGAGGGAAPAGPATPTPAR